MKDDGFMMLDSVLTMLIFSIILSVLVPAMIMLNQTVSDSAGTLEFTRRLYIDMLAYEDYESFMLGSHNYRIEAHRICDKNDAKLCVHIE
ncbi:hypothetical protein J4760_03025 [Salinicoccus sp. ID82-1]|uniref:Type II secretion system protein n=1 Tax=Salinicoccus cyprini TaxID=2493691 RepID=A0A558AZ01_9STAP|nr:MULTISPECIES: hypothetical protein [Salinicoccus]MCG1009022.1 hypothetical protein [Salinicoccus sp. ID82-1]TVT29473.1 hypothetical protein FO441_04095 [Salinicoccus cyprini]